MNFFFLLICLTFLGSAYAELIPKDERDIYDLMWLPRKGIFYGATKVTFEDQNFERKVPGDPVKVHQSSQLISQALGYSLSDRLSLQVESDYLMRRKVTFTPDQGSETITEDKGLGEPSIAARWRIFSQERNSLNIDLVPQATYSRGKFERGTGLEEGNNLNGGQSYSLKLEVGKKYQKFQWMSYAGLMKVDEAKGKDLRTLEEQTQSEYSVYQAGLRVLAPIESEEKYFLMGGFNYAREGSSTLSDRASRAKSEATSRAFFEGALTYLRNEHIAFTGSFELGAISDYDMTDQLGNRTGFKNGSYTSFSALARYQF